MIEVSTTTGVQQKYKDATVRAEIPQDNFLELATIGYPWELVQETDWGYLCILSIASFSGNTVQLYSELNEEVYVELEEMLAVR